MPECNNAWSDLSDTGKNLHVTACLKSWTAAQYAQQLKDAILSMHEVEDGGIPCPIIDGVFACKEKFTCNNLPTHFDARILARRIMLNQFYCQIQGSCSPHCISPR